MGQTVRCCIPSGGGNESAHDELAALRSGSGAGVVDTEASASQKKAASLLKDFNAQGDDVKELTAAQLAKMTPIERFSKIFPFYRMDVNGFSLRTK